MVLKQNVAYAGFWIRFIASIIDILILFPFFWVVSRLFFYLPGGFFKISFVIIIIHILIDCFYEIILTSKFGGTLGKLLMRIEVTNAGGIRLSLANSTLRYFSKWLSTILLGIGFLMIAWDEKKRGLHDKIAKTFVVNNQKSKLTPKIKITVLVLTIIFLIGYLFYLITLFTAAFKAEFYILNSEDPFKSLNNNCNSKLFWQKDICIESLAENEIFDDFAIPKRIDVCMEIKGKNLRSQCLSNLAILTGNKSICEQGLPKYYIQNCLKTYNSTFSLIGEVPSYTDPETKKKAANYTASIPQDFDEMFKSFQKINKRFIDLSSMYLDDPAEIRIANSNLDDINMWIDDAKSINKKIKEKIAEFKKLNLKKESLEKLDKLEAISNQYSESLKNLELAQENYRNYIEYFDFQAKLFQEAEKFNSHFDLSNEYKDEEKYDKALEELDKAIILQEKVLSIRKEQLENKGKYKMEFIADLYNEEVKYTEFIYKKREELQELVSNPKKPLSQRFLESDKIYNEYNQIFMEDTEYGEFLAGWFNDNIGIYIEKSNDILTDTDIDYNSFMKDFNLYWE